MTSKTLPWSRNWATDPDRNRSRILEAQAGSGMSASKYPSVQLAGARLRGQGRRLGNQVVHRADRLLLIGDPLAGGAERGADLVDPLRQAIGVGREHRLFADQLDL